MNWSRLAEKAVRKGMDPDEAARLSVEADSIIYSWLKGAEKAEAIDKRNKARDILVNYRPYGKRTWGHSL